MHVNCSVFELLVSLMKLWWDVILLKLKIIASAKIVVATMIPLNSLSIHTCCIISMNDTWVNAKFGINMLIWTRNRSYIALWLCLKQWVTEIGKMCRVEEPKKWCEVLWIWRYSCDVGDAKQKWIIIRVWWW